MSNYRPISVLCIISEIIERAVHDQLFNYLSEHGILHPSQSSDHALEIVFFLRNQTNVAYLDLVLNGLFLT